MSLTTKGPKGQVYVWPSFRFNAQGEKRLFDTPDDVLPGWARSAKEAASLPVEQPKPRQTRNTRK